MPPPPTPATPAPATGGLTGPSPDKLTFSAKKRFFEKEIQESTQPATKPGKNSLSSYLISSFKKILHFVLIFFFSAEKRFSFLSEDEVNKLRQEEGITRDIFLQHCRLQ
jgi:hypothetical protein